MPRGFVICLAFRKIVPPPYSGQRQLINIPGAFGIVGQLIVFKGAAAVGMHPHPITSIGKNPVAQQSGIAAALHHHPCPRIGKHLIVLQHPRPLSWAYTPVWRP